MKNKLHIRFLWLLVPFLAASCLYLFLYQYNNKYTRTTIQPANGLLILILKLIYRDKIMGEGLNATVTTLEEMREYGKNTNLITRKLTDAEWRDALYVMRVHQMIDVPGAVKDVEDTTPIYIYSTINLYCASLDIDKIVEKYREELKEEDLEAGEEDHYEDADQ